LKDVAEWTWRSGGGSLFHARARRPAAANDRYPNDDVFFVALQLCQMRQILSPITSAMLKFQLMKILEFPRLFRYTCIHIPAY